MTPATTPPLLIATIAGGAAALALGLLLSCSVPGGYRLHVRNVDGPPVTVWIEGQLVASVGCGDPPVVISGPTLPPTPWEIGVFTKDGTSYGSERAGTAGFREQTLFIRDIGVFLVPPVDAAVGEVDPVGGCPARSAALAPARTSS